MSDYPINQTALVLVDPLNEFFSEKGKLWPFTQSTIKANNTIENITRLTLACRSQGIKIVYANHHASEVGDYDNRVFLTPTQQSIKDNQIFSKGSFGAQVYETLTPQEGDLIAQDHYCASGFANTDLDLLLKQHGINRLLIAGNRANTCVESTGRYAVELGYHATLISDAIAAFNEVEMENTIKVNWPAFGHNVINTDKLIDLIS